MPSFFSSGQFCSLACALIWAAAVIMYRKGGEVITPFALNFFKDCVALGAFLITLPLVGRSWFPSEYGWSEWLTLLVSGAIGIGIADTVFFASLNRLGAMGSAVVTSLYGPFVVLTAFVYLGEPLRLPVLVGVCLMVSAIIIGAIQKVSRSTRLPHARILQRTSDRSVLFGVILGVIAVALWAIGIVVAKPVLNRADLWWAATVRILGGVVLLAIQALLPSNRAAVLDCFRPGRLWGVTVPGAVLGNYIGMILFITGFAKTTAGIAGVLSQTSSIFVLILAAIFLRERITARKTLAIAIAFAGAVVVAI
jgi:drug/metabolite transporter (DMT)-like permease